MQVTYYKPLKYSKNTPLALQFKVVIESIPMYLWYMNGMRSLKYYDKNITHYLALNIAK